MLRFFSTCTILVCLTISAIGGVKSVLITYRDTILGGKTFGSAGAYEIWKGEVVFEFDPRNSQNGRISDISLAKKNANDLVEAKANIVILKPVDLSKASGIGLVEVSNRGGKFSLNYFNRAATSILDPQKPEAFGDGLLMEMGVILVWIGWQTDLPVQENMLRLEAPAAFEKDGNPIQGLIRSDWVIDEPVNTLNLGHRDMVPYPVSNPESVINSLTVRNSKDGQKRTVPSSEWTFGRYENDSIIASPLEVSMKNGFQSGNIYELTYMAENPLVSGLGLLVIRDIISFMKYNPACDFKVKQGIAVGVSQTGRFLRQFIYEGLNADEAGQTCYDGLLIITAGAGRGSFNHRFAQPSRDAHAYSSFNYPVDIFPFTSRTQTDPALNNNSDGLFYRKNDQARKIKIFHINTGYEYWNRAASLIHTDIFGLKDIPPFDNERIYHIASGQHFTGRIPESFIDTVTYPYFSESPVNLNLNYRSLLVRMVKWVTDSITPPDNKYPKIENKTLVTAGKNYNFPILESIYKPTTQHSPRRANYGSAFSRGIIQSDPPILGDPYPILVPQVDLFGNELGGIRNPEVAYPVASYTPWSLRGSNLTNPYELRSFRGNMIPLALNNQDRVPNKDLRPSLSTTYRSSKDYFRVISNYTDSLIGQGFILPQDRYLSINHAMKLWDATLQHYSSKFNRNVQAPSNGTLMLIGGGQISKEIYDRFAQEIGGYDAPIIIIPTAMEEQELGEDPKFEKIKRTFESFGFKKVYFLHSTDRNEANQDKFYKDFDKTKGVFILGGRQWRLADAYLGTKMISKLQNLLAQGGVIAGTSAGATIMGSYLVRGDTKTNQIMMGDHQEGFGFIKNVAIDQHVLSRNRQFDLYEIINKHPSLLGLALDERACLVVKNQLGEVIGDSYVLVYDGKEWSEETSTYHYTVPNDPNFYILQKGDKYDFSSLKIIPKSKSE